MLRDTGPTCADGGILASCSHFPAPLLAHLPLPRTPRRVKQICRLLPLDVRLGIVVGLGLLLTMLGLQHMHVVVASPYSMVELGPIGLPLCYGCA